VTNEAIPIQCKQAIRIRRHIGAAQQRMRALERAEIGLCISEQAHGPPCVQLALRGGRGGARRRAAFACGCPRARQLVVRYSRCVRERARHFGLPAFPGGNIPYQTQGAFGEQRVRRGKIARRQIAQRASGFDRERRIAAEQRIESRMQIEECYRALLGMHRLRNADDGRPIRGVQGLVHVPRG